MEIQFFLPAQQGRESVILLRDFLRRDSINGISEIEILRTPHRPGEMGLGDLTNSIKTIIEAAEKPLVELIRCLLKYVDNYRTTITIPTKEGNIVLQHGRSMKPEQLQELVISIQENIK